MSRDSSIIPSQVFEFAPSSKMAKGVGWEGGWGRGVHIEVGLELSDPALKRQVQERDSPSICTRSCCLTARSP